MLFIVSTLLALAMSILVLYILSFFAVGILKFLILFGWFMWKVFVVVFLIAFLLLPFFLVMFLFI